ncbi:chemotaxis protein CheW [Desulfurispirillum indicum]|uniref:CheW domain protein n=1 Tax=Desulfurispirillum indicum (strain ATCC BAA-1389 / DSM 22839 / S5) TaxID=653733 RepID=E6W083_DESIS|nr:chemotaxis protein CheW [Desulfurispirillum indicum]ADU65209.1 CheW domain protein [Desulfurispirillum indicum S5]UCZ57099.1 chemotaxis protein CheW [Desulfurispirillum indicum]
MQKSKPQEEKILDTSLTENNDEMLQFVSFMLHDEEYLVDIHMVREIIKKTTITSIPKSSSFMEGIIDLRGSVIPIINLAKKLGHPTSDLQEETNIIIVSVQGKLIGLVVDAVREVVRIRNSQVEANPSIAKGGRQRLGGVVQYQDRLLILLDMNSLFSEGEMDDILSNT